MGVLPVVHCAGCLLTRHGVGGVQGLRDVRTLTRVAKGVRFALGRATEEANEQDDPDDKYDALDAHCCGHAHGVT